jgi:PAS domain S-box-containing protein
MELDKEKEKISILLEDLAFFESYIKDLFSFFPLPICIVSSIGIILEANPVLEEISGYKLEELIGKSVDEIFKKEEIKNLIKETNEKGFVKDKEITFLNKEKKEISVSVSMKLRKSEEGEVIGYFLSFFDLTEIKKIEKELKRKINDLEKAREEEIVLRIREKAKSHDIEVKVRELENTRKALLNILEDVYLERKRAEEERNKTLIIIQNFADGIMVFDDKNLLFLINPEAERILNLRKEEVVGKSIFELKEIPQFQLIFELLGPEMKQVFREEIKLKEELVIEVTSIPLISDKTRTGSLVILHDISREKLVERMKSEFVSVAAHQLRTPLSAIKWTLKMILDGDLGEITKEQREFLEKTYQSNERMINLINDLLNVTRIEEGRYLYKMVLADIGEICQTLIDNYKDEIERRNLKIKFQKPKALPKVMVDIEKISLAIQNLLENAIKYNLPGGEIEINLKRKDKEVEFVIKDTGVGIPKNQQGKVFTKFFRASNAMKIETEGSGLGLFITKNIVEAHGGKIWFESEEGKGTTFYFTLPIKSPFETFAGEW